MGHIFSKLFNTYKGLSTFKNNNEKTELGTLLNWVTSIGSILGLFLSGTVIIIIAAILLLYLTVASFTLPINIISDANETGVLKSLELFEKNATIEGVYDIPSYINRIENYYETDLNLIIAIDTVLNGDTGINEKNIKNIMKKTYRTEVREEEYTTTITIQNSDGTTSEEEETVTEYILEIYNLSKEEIFNNFKFNEKEIHRVEDIELMLDDGMINILADIDYTANIYDSNIDLSNLKIYDEGTANIIYYSQLDKRWGNKKYGRSTTIAEGGCCPTSMSMIISSLTEKRLYPDELADWSYKNGYRAEGKGSYWSLVSKSAEEYGLTVTKISKYNPEKVLENLERGIPVVAIMGKGHFTKGGHFIVLRGITSEQKILVNDPASIERTNKEWDKKIIFNEASKSGIYTFWAIERGK